MTKIHDPKLIKSAAGTINPPKTLKNSGLAGPGKQNFVTPIPEKPEANIVIPTTKKEVSTVNNKTGGEFYNADAVKTSVVPEDVKKIEGAKGLSVNSEKGTSIFSRFVRHFKYTENNTKNNKEIIIRDAVATEQKMKETFGIPKNLDVSKFNNIKPLEFTEHQWDECCHMAAKIDCLNAGIPLEAVSLYQVISSNLVGRLANTTHHMMNRLQIAPPIANYKLYITPDLFNNIPTNVTDLVTKIKPEDPPTRVYEIMTLGKHNNSQLPQLEFNYDQAVASWCYNNTPNEHPDFIWKLNAQISTYTHMSLDVKFGETSFFTKDIIRGCTKDLAIHTMDSHIGLDKQLTRLSKKPLTTLDEDLIDNLKFDIDQNINKFLVNKDAENFAITFNDFRYKYQELLIRNGIGMNSLVQISENDIMVEDPIKKFYDSRFNYYKTNPESDLFMHANKAIDSAKTNGLSINFYTILSEFLATKTK